MIIIVNPCSCPPSRRLHHHLSRIFTAIGQLDHEDTRSSSPAPYGLRVTHKTLTHHHNAASRNQRNDLQARSLHRVPFRRSNPLTTPSPPILHQTHRLALIHPTFSQSMSETEGRSRICIIPITLHSGCESPVFRKHNIAANTAAASSLHLHPTSRDRRGHLHASEIP